MLSNMTVSRSPYLRILFSRLSLSSFGKLMFGELANELDIWNPSLFRTIERRRFCALR